MMPVGTYYYKDTENNITVFEIRNNAEITMIEVTEENTIIKTIHKNCNENEIILYKTDEQGNPLAGAVFGLIDMYGDKTSFACSNIDGKVIFKHLEKGTYIVREIEAPYGYSKSSSNIIFTINENWINQEERIKNGENFNEVYIVVADSRYEQTQNIIDSEPEMIIEYEKFTEMNRIL